MQKLSDAQLRGKTADFRQQIDNGASLDDLLIPAYAVAREAGKRVLGMRHYDVQLVGGIVLHQGKIAEMKTGEGKTLMATLAVYLNSLAGNSSHVVTVNDYLARRDAEWMGPVYRALGLTVGVVVPGMTPPAKRAAYACDVIYATNNELGFDYLRDNMAFSPDQKVQRDLSFAIVDEVDSILIDEARTTFRDGLQALGRPAGPEALRLVLALNHLEDEQGDERQREVRAAAVARYRHDDQGDRVGHGENGEEPLGKRSRNREAHEDNRRSQAEKEQGRFAGRHER